ncbi:MAG: hypothetical protein J7L55_03910 [Desulfurococcales archaeon]|nr:hypothetical protein [Desulfurococcales archaeon]
MIEVYVGINNVSSPQRLVDAVKTILAFEAGGDLEIKGVVVTKASGMAAQAGVPDASRLMYREGKPLILLPTLKDAVELLKPDMTLLNEQVKDSAAVCELEVPPNSRVLYVVSGHEDGFLKQELALGTPVKFAGISRYVPPAAAVALFLTEIRSLT